MEVSMLLEIINNKFQTIGYVLKEDDNKLLTQMIDEVILDIEDNYNFKVEKYINRLKYVIANRVVGYFLYTKKSFDILNISNLDFNDSIISSLSVGDTSTSFKVDKNKSKEELFDEFVNYLQSFGTNSLLRYRRIGWSYECKKP
ncbi:hypothetical protein [Anaerofustis stercorihominis]|uniref:hypothetical protein n=1 Tax=Anaerofustis stercorihominis TaxID=214853 RepID=UPI0039939583